MWLEDNLVFWNRFVFAKKPKWVWYCVCTVLYPFELLYIFFFKIWCFYSLRKPRYRTNAKTISIGNISAGGTGKTALTRFLLNKLNNRCSAVIMRGYGGVIAQLGQNLLIKNPEINEQSIALYGDEAVMLSCLTNALIAIGSKKADSASLLEKSGQFFEFIILDDAYQNQNLYKDQEILLINAEQPFGNGHCFPLGMHREFDVARADIIIFTHAKNIEQSKLCNLERLFLKKGFKGSFFAGAYRPVGFVDELWQHKKVLPRDHIFFAFAGIGSFAGFHNTLLDLKVALAGTREFIDHAVYSPRVIHLLMLQSLQIGANALITTLKDLVKILPLLSQIPCKDRLPIYAVDVDFYLLDDKKEPILLRLLGI